MNRPSNRNRTAYGAGRDALLDAAARVAARQGFASLTYRSVAEEAGTTHTLVAYHFDSLDELIHEATTKAVGDAIQGSALRPASMKLEDMAKDFSRLGTEQPDAQAFQYELVLEARRHPALRPDAEAMYAEYISVVQGVLAEFGVSDDPALARAVFAVFDGLMLRQLLLERPEETDEALRAFIAMLEVVRDASARSKRSRSKRTNRSSSRGGSVGERSR